MAKVAEKTKTAEKAKAATLESDVLTLEEATVYLKLPKGVLEKQLALGTIPGRNIGGHWRFFKPALNQWLSKQAEGKNPLSNKEIFLSQAGVFADDPTFPQLIEQIYANRRQMMLDE